MALRIPIRPATLTAGLDSLVVFGVSASLERRRDRRRSSPTCSTRTTTPTARVPPPRHADQQHRRSPRRLQPDDPGHERSFAIEVARHAAARATTTRCASAPRSACRSIGIAPTFGRVERGARARRPRHAQHEHRAVAGGLGLLPQQHDRRRQPGSRGDDLDWAREHFLDHVRSFGPLPALRCGAQPYGVLPVTSLDLWQPGAAREPTAQDTWLEGHAARRCATTSGARRSATVRAHRQPAEPARSRCRSRRRDAHRCDSPAAIARATSSAATILQHLRASWRGSAATGFVADSDPAQTALLQQLGIAWRPRLSRACGMPTGMDRLAPLVQAGEVSPWAKLEPNYIAALLAEPQHRAADPRAARSAGCRLHDAACCRCCCATRCCARLAYAAARLAGRRAGRRSRGAAARRRARRSRHRRAADHALEAPARQRPRGHRRPTRSASSSKPDHLHDAGLAALGEFRASLDASARISTAKPCAADAGHARSVGASARRVDHVGRDQAARRDARRRPAGPVRRRVRLGRKPASRCRPRS